MQLILLINVVSPPYYSIHKYFSNWNNWGRKGSSYAYKCVVNTCEFIIFDTFLFYFFVLRNGTISNFDGLQLNTKESLKLELLLKRFGCQISSYSISKSFLYLSFFIFLFSVPMETTRFPSCVMPLSNTMELSCGSLRPYTRAPVLLVSLSFR